MTSLQHFLSDGAYDRLIAYARTFGYIREPSDDSAYARDLRARYGHSVRIANSSRGLSSFVTVLSRASFTETLPSSVRKRHDSEIEAGLNPSWRLLTRGFSDKAPHYLSITDEVADRYVAIAITFGILGPRRRGGPRKNNKTSIVAAVLEAIGAELLTPDLATIPAASTLRNFDRRYVLDERRTEPVQPVANFSWTSSDDREA